MVQGQKRGGVSHQISPRTLVIPVNFFAAYEAVAARLTTLKAGAQFPVYIAPEGEITVTINRITPRKISAPGVEVDLQEYDLTFARPGMPMSVGYGRSLDDRQSPTVTWDSPRSAKSLPR